MKRWQHIVWKWTAGTVAALVILSATLAGLFRLFAPLVPGYRAEVQTWASRTLGRPVRITAMGAQWGLYGPEITLEKIALLSKNHRRIILTARELRIGFTPGALLHGRFSRPNRIILIEPQVVLERDTDGSFEVRGLEGSLSPGQAHTDWRGVLAETFAQSAQIIISGGAVTLFDRRAPAAPLIFSNLSLKIDNSAGSHEMYGHVQLPAALGRNLTFAGRIQGAGIKPQTWRWRGDVQGTALNMPRLLSYWPRYSGRFASGLVDLRAAASGEGGSLDEVRASINAHNVFPTGNGAVRAGFSTLAGTLSWIHSSGGWTLSGRNMQLQSGNDIWPASDFDLRYAYAQNGAATWSGGATFLRLQDIVILTGWLPENFSSSVSTRLLRLSPTGDVTDVNFQAQWSGKALGNWSLHGRFTGLGLRADGNIPGFTGLDGGLDVNQDGGTLRLVAKNASATFPHLFRAPLQAVALSTDVQFHHDAQGWHIATGDLAVANPDAQVQAKGTLLLPADGGSPLIDLQATVQNARVKNKSAYLPARIMPKAVVSWLDTSIVSGRVPAGSLILRGRLADFPFDKGQGLFDIRFHITHGVLDYAKNWPRVEHLDADVEFKNQGMSVAVQHGSMLDDDISGTTADFADLSNGVLDIRGRARGSARTTLDFLRSGPLKKRFGHYLDGLRVSGRNDISLHLLLPVTDPARFKLNGRDQLGDVSVDLAGRPEWRLSRLRGSVAFSDAGIRTDNLRGMLLGGAVTISLHPQKHGKGTTVVSARGGATAAALSVALPAPFNKVLAGNTVWQLSGSLPNDPAGTNGGLSLELRSNLRGLGVDLPAPFGKSADAIAPLDASLRLTGDAGLLLQVRYAHTMNGEYRFLDENGGWQFDRGALVFGTAEPSLPATQGLVVSGALAEFSLDAWKPYATTSGSELLPPFLHSLDVGVGRFSGFGQDIVNLHVQLARASHAWHATLASMPIAGRVTWPYRVDPAHPIVADMQRVTFMHSPNGKKNSASALNPHAVPPLRFTAGQFRYNGVILDNVHADFTPRPDGVDLKAFSVAGTGFSITGGGQWVARSGGTQECSLSAQMKSTDIGKTLRAFGYAPGITGDKGELQASLHWQGGPFGDIVTTLNGKMHVKLENGHLLEVKPGAGRIFGLLSIGALPRHLLLNFSDVLGKGFAYDSIEADFTLQDGDAYTGDLTVAGSAAQIHVVGRTGLAKHDFDEALIVNPSVGSTLPLLSALAGGVGVGAVVYLLTRIFRKPLNEVGEMRYRLTGTWDNPILTPVAEPEGTTHGQHG